MNRFLMFGSLAAFALLVGCDAGGSHPTTQTEKKSFLGGPMPPDVQKKFQESMAQNNATRMKQAHAGQPPAGQPTAGQ